ncbi:MAG: SDR family oxidoreductase [Acidimicrobiia bacterium]|nr:SDR family oxidoreductase [Acidimicrobiia bacterium]
MQPLDPFQPFRLDGKVALVTGASSGLGERFARVLDAAGAKVALTARRADRLNALAADLTDALAIPCDLADDEQRSRIVPETLERFGRIDLLINNAGSSEPMRALDEPVEHFRDTLELNLVAPFALARDVALAMVAQKSPGVIINIASIYGVTGIGRVPTASYSASKGGLVSLTRELASQWSRKQIRVNALAPGYFRSEMTTELFADQRLVDWVQEKTPLARVGEEHELDGALLFLASDASSYVTGQILCIDGGWTAI